MGLTVDLSLFCVERGELYQYQIGRTFDETCPRSAVQLQGLQLSYTQHPGEKQSQIRLSAEECPGVGSSLHRRGAIHFEPHWRVGLVDSVQGVGGQRLEEARAFIAQDTLRSTVDMSGRGGIYRGFDKFELKSAHLKLLQVVAEEHNASHLMIVVVCLWL